MMKFSIFNLQFSIPNRGFTVLETMVAIMVASLAIAGATLAARGGIRAGSIAKEEVRAFYLAQETLEFLSNRRDTNEIRSFLGAPSTTWLSGVAALSSDPCYPGKTCILDPYNAFTPFTTCSGSCPYLRQSAADYRYNYTSGNQTPYKREISIEKPSADQAIVTIKITWDHAGTQEQFTTKTLLANWFTSATSGD